MSGYEKIIWDRISKITIIIEPLPSPVILPPITPPPIIIPPPEPGPTPIPEPPPIISPPITPPPIIIPPSSWYHDCNNLQGVHEAGGGSLPTQGDGFWRFQIPAYTQKNVDIFTDKSDFGFGDYTVRFRVNGPRPNIHHYCPLWLEFMNKPGGYEELDLAEMFGSKTYGTNSPRQTAITSYHGTVSNVSTSGFFDSTVEFEDNNWHTLKAYYRPESVFLYIDDVFQREFKPTGNTMAQPPMTLSIYVEGGGQNEREFILDVDSITFSPS